MEPPADVVGLPLDEAEEQLRGQRVRVEVTNPWGKAGSPGVSEVSSEYRVLRQLPAEDGEIVLTVAAEPLKGTEEFTE